MRLNILLTLLALAILGAGWVVTADPDRATAPAVVTRSEPLVPALWIAAEGCSQSPSSQCTAVVLAVNRREISEIESAEIYDLVKQLLQKEPVSVEIIAIRCPGSPMRVERWRYDTAI